MSNLSQINPDDLLVQIANNTLSNREPVNRHLSDLRDLFIDKPACEAALKNGNPLVYSVASVEPADGDAQLHYGLGTLYPGRIGDEYYFTKGHYHAHRPAAEIYIGLSGEGLMQLEDEATRATQLVSLKKNAIIYVPGHTAHRTINTGETPLTYLGIYPANAGHDYAPIAQNNFTQAVVCKDGKPTLIQRSQN